MSPHLLVTILQIASAAGYCYSRNGTTLLNPAFEPCSNTTTHSACCMTNHSGAGDVGIANDVCMENGLCQNYAVFNGENEGQPVWSRQGCTDPLWNSPYCLGEFGDHWGNVGVWNCGGRNWCCGEKSCCNDKDNIFELAATVGPTSTSLSATVPSATYSSSSSTFPTWTPTASSSREENFTTEGLGTGAKAGIGAGIAVFVTVATATVLLVLKLGKLNGKKDTFVDRSIPATGILKEQKYPQEAHTYELSSNHGYAELGQREHAELAANNVPQELEAGNGNIRSCA